MANQNNIFKNEPAFEDKNPFVSGDNRGYLQQIYRHLYNVHSDSDGLNVIYDYSGISITIDWEGLRTVPALIVGFDSGTYTADIYADGVSESPTEEDVEIVIAGDDTGIFYDSEASEGHWFLARQITDGTYEASAQIVIPDLDTITSLSASDLMLVYDGSNYKAIRADNLILALLKLLPSYNGSATQGILNDSGSIQWITAKPC